MPLRKMNIDRQFILAQGESVSPERKFGFYRWVVRICKSDTEEMA